MTTNSKTSDRKVLIVEDMHEVSKNLQISLASNGFKKIHTVSNVNAALERIAHNQYDIILCDYNLGEGPNGQQLLEYLRREEKISKNAMFIIFTAENSYKTVVSAAEHQPDDYMLKPFTTSNFIQRLERLNDYYSAMARVNAAFADGSMTNVIEETNKIIELKDKNYYEASKLKAVALYTLSRYQEAHALYEQVVAVRALPWAQLGLAKCKFKLGDISGAKKICNKNIKENPHHLQSIDFLSEIYLSEGEREEAEAVLKRASKISPHSIDRSRVLGSILMSNGDFEGAETTLVEAIRSQKHSLIKSALDYSLLAKAMIAQDKIDDAFGVIGNARKQFSDYESSALLAGVSSMVYLKEGNKDKAEEEVRLALMADVDNVSPEAASFLAEVFCVNGMNAEAQRFIDRLRDLEQDNVYVKSQVGIASAMTSSANNVSVDRPLLVDQLVDQYHVYSAPRKSMKL